MRRRRDPRRRRPRPGWRARRSAASTRSACAGSAGRCAPRSWPRAGAAPATPCWSRRWGPTSRRSLPAAARPVARLARVLAAGRRAAAVVGADAQTVLWALWSAAEQAEPWRRSALAGGAAGERADRDLDAVLALFRAAETFVDRMPRSTPGAFVDWLQAQDLPSDSLAARARRASVQVLTPAGAAGREWDLVVVAGVQEGAWPDLRLRDSLLGAQALVDLVAGRAVPGAADDAETAAAARDAVLADELRSFVVACSRARRSLLVTAVDDADQQPSPFLELVDPSDDEGETRRTSVPAPLDLRGPRRAAAGAPRAGGGRRRRAGPRGGPHARAAGGGRRAPARTRRSGTASPNRPARRRCGTRTRACRSRRRRSRRRSAARCGGRWRRRAGRRRPAAGRASARCCTRSRRSTRRARRPSCPRRSTGGGASSGSATGGRRWPRGARRTRWSHRLAVYLRTAGEPLLVEGAFAVDTDRASLRGSVDRIELVEDGADGAGRAGGRPQDRRQPAQRRARPPRTRSSAPTSSRSTPARSTGSPTGRRAAARSSCSSARARPR